MISRKNLGRGFTLIELVIVMLIIAILMAFAIPAFLGQRTKAADRTAQQTIRSAVSAVKTYTADRDDFGALATNGGTALTAVEPNIEWTATSVERDADRNNDRPVAFHTVPNAGGRSTKQMTMTTIGGDSMCWGVSVYLDERPDTYFAVPATAGVCSATTFYTTTPTTQQARTWPDRPATP